MKGKLAAANITQIINELKKISSLNKIKKDKLKFLKGSKIIASLVLVTIIGIGGGFYIGEEYGRTSTT